MENLLLYILAGESLTVLKENEIVSKTRDQATAHICSKDCAGPFFEIVDINLAMYKDLQTQNTYGLTSSAIIENSDGPQTKVYGWSETARQITFFT